MVEDTNQVTDMSPGTAIVRTGERKRLWTIIGVMWSIIIIAAVVIVISIILIRKKDKTIPSFFLTTSSATTDEMTISTSRKIETLTNSPTTMLDIISTVLVPMKWKQQATTIAGGNWYGSELNQLYFPMGISIDQHQTIYIADWNNHRVVQWKSGAKEGKITAGGNGKGTRLDQLNDPMDVCVDEQNNSLIIADSGNKRVIRCTIENPIECQLLFSDVRCYSVTIDKNGAIYISDDGKHEVRRWGKGETEGTVVAGGNGLGHLLNQLHNPSHLFVDVDESIYISDLMNYRVMKWRKDAREGTVVAGGNDHGSSLNKLSTPYGVIVDHLGQIYVVDSGNHRVMRWCEGCKEGEIVIGGNGDGVGSNQLSRPVGLSFDVEGNLYVSDIENSRVQKFELDLK